MELDGACPFLKGMLRDNEEGILAIIELEVSVAERECVEVGAVGGGCASVAMAARYWMTFFVLSVLPAPDSPTSATAEPFGTLNETPSSAVVRPSYEKLTLSAGIGG